MIKYIERSRYVRAIEVINILYRIHVKLTL